MSPVPAARWHAGATGRAVVATMVVGVLCGCSAAGSAQSATTKEPTTPPAAVTATPMAALSGQAWVDQMCTTLNQLSPTLTQSPPGDNLLNATDADIANLQAWLAQRATADKAMAAQMVVPMTSDFAQLSAWMKAVADKLAWDATWSQNMRTKLASMPAKDAATYWIKVTDNGSTTYDGSLAGTLVPSPSPVPTPPTDPETLRQGDEMDVYTKQHPGCSDLLDQAMNSHV